MLLHLHMPFPEGLPANVVLRYEFILKQLLYGIILILDVVFFKNDYLTIIYFAGIIDG